MTRYGLAFVVVRGLAVIVLLFAVWEAGDAVLMAVRWGSEQNVGYPLVICAVHAALALVLWAISGPLARRIAGHDGDDSSGKLSADEAMLLRVVFVGMGATSLLFAASELLRAIAQSLFLIRIGAADDKVAGTLAYRSTLNAFIWSGLAEGILLAVAGVVLIVGCKRIASWVVRLRKFD